MESVIVIALMLAGLVFLVFLPQRRAQKQHEQLVASLRPGARVMLTSGIHGTVVSLGETTMQLEVAPGTHLEVATRAVAQVVEAPTATPVAEHDVHETDEALEADHETEPDGSVDPDPIDPPAGNGPARVEAPDTQKPSEA
ncbi:hypothetical protein GCM10027418_12730 [Mariniluteicoccus endophyticus]